MAVGHENSIGGGFMELRFSAIQTEKGRARRQLRLVRSQPVLNTNCEPGEFAGSVKIDAMRRSRTLRSSGEQIGTAMRSRLMAIGVSGSAALVTMMKATDFRDRDNRAGIGQLYAARFRTIFLERQMSSCSVIVLGVCLQMPHQTPLVEYDQVIQTLPPNAANHALNIRSLPG